MYGDQGMQRANRDGMQAGSGNLQGNLAIQDVDRCVDGDCRWERVAPAGGLRCGWRGALCGALSGEDKGLVCREAV